MHAPVSTITLTTFPLDFLILFFVKFLFSFLFVCFLSLSTSCHSSFLPLFIITSIPFILKFMGFYPFVPQVVPTSFGFLWASLQDYLLTYWLPGHYLCSEGACHTILYFQTKVLVLFLSHSLPFSPQRIKVEGSLHLLLWHASSGPNLCLPLLGEIPSQQSIFLKGVSAGTLKQISFLPTVKPHPLNLLTEGPAPMYWLGTRKWCPGPYASATAIQVCLLSFPRHFCRSCAAFFCHLYRVMFVFCGVRHVWAFGLALPLSFLRGMGIVQTRAFTHIAHWVPIPVIPLILPMGLPVVIPTMLAHWACYLFSQASQAHLFHLYLLFFPRVCQLLFLSCWPIGLATSFLGPLGLLPLFLGFLSSLTLSLPLILSMGLLAVILVMLAHWACYLFSWASLTHLLHFYLIFFPWTYWLLFLPCQPIGLTTSFLVSLTLYFIFTFYSSHGFASCYSCHVGSLGLTTHFFHSHFFFSFFLL